MVGEVNVIGIILIVLGAAVIFGLNVRLFASKTPASDKFFYMPNFKEAVGLFGGLAFIAIGLKMIGWF